MNKEEIRKKFVETYYQMPTDFRYKGDLYQVADWWLEQMSLRDKELVEEIWEWAINNGITDKKSFIALRNKLNLIKGNNDL